MSCLFFFRFIKIFTNNFTLGRFEPTGPFLVYILSQTWSQALTISYGQHLVYTPSLLAKDYMKSLGSSISYLKPWLQWAEGILRNFFSEIFFFSLFYSLSICLSNYLSIYQPIDAVTQTNTPQQLIYPSVHQCIGIDALRCHYSREPCSSTAADNDAIIPFPPWRWSTDSFLISLVGCPQSFKLRCSCLMS